jgi:hypothetical protein
MPIGCSAWALVAVLSALATACVSLSSAAFTSPSSNTKTNVTAHADWTAPTVSASVIAKTAGGASQYIRQGASFYLYASLRDGGNPASGTVTATADVSSISTGQTATRLLAGSYAADGTTYNYRSEALSANGTLSDGSYTSTVTLTDAAANTVRRAGPAVNVDSSPPYAGDVQASNTVGGTRGKLELGDQLLLTYSEPIDPHTVLAGWSGAATNVTVRVTDGALQNDVLTIRNAANTAQLPLGSIDAKRRDFVIVTRDFTGSQIVRNGNVIAVTLGTPSGATGTAASSASMSWNPSASATDRAGNQASTSAVTESGTVDIDF